MYGLNHVMHISNAVNNYGGFGDVCSCITVM